MRPEASQYLQKAHKCLSNATAVLAISINDVAAKEAYLAGYHAAEALIFERTGKTAKTHKGVRAEFARLSRGDPELRKFAAFLARAYELKSVADYEVGPDVQISPKDATEAIETASQLIMCVAERFAVPIQGSSQ